MKRVNFFDLGMNRGAVCDCFLKDVSNLNLDVHVIGFEPMPYIYEDLINKYKNNTNVEIHPYAISNQTSEQQIYSANCYGGHSLFNDHDAVIKNPNETKKSFDIKAVLFSDFIKENEERLKIDNSLNILKSNIEGSEYYLFNDIIDSGLYKKFKIFCGTPDEAFDIFKVKSLKQNANNLIEKIQKSGILIKRYTAIFNNPCPRNFNIAAEIENILSE